MYTVTNPFDPLKTCIVGRCYPPEFFHWVKNKKAREILERVAIETEEDFQNLIAILESFGVEVLRPNVQVETSIDNYNPPPVTPRDFILMSGNRFIFSEVTKSFISDDEHPMDTFSHMFYDDIIESINDKCIIDIVKDKHSNNTIDYSSGAITQYDDLFFSSNGMVDSSPYDDFGITQIKHMINQNTRFMPLSGHLDGQFCIIKRGVVLCTEWVPLAVAEEYFPDDWEILYIPTVNWQSDKLNLPQIKEKTNGRWWIPGEDLTDDIIDVVDTWLSNWVGYSEETNFSINMLSIDEENIIVPSPNITIDGIFKKHNITPHVCNFRHSIFWDGGLHCITSDINREIPKNHV